MHLDEGDTEDFIRLAIAAYADHVQWVTAVLDSRGLLGTCPTCKKRRLKETLSVHVPRCVPWVPSGEEDTELVRGWLEDLGYLSGGEGPATPARAGPPEHDAAGPSTPAPEHVSPLSDATELVGEAPTPLWSGKKEPSRFAELAGLMREIDLIQEAAAAERAYQAQSGGLHLPRDAKSAQLEAEIDAVEAKLDAEIDRVGSQLTDLLRGKISLRNVRLGAQGRA